MAINSKILRGSAVLTLNEIVSNGCSFVRSYILARVISKGDNGVAATLAVTFLFLELISKMAFGQQVITSKNGGDRKFVDTGHAIQLAFGIVSAVLFVLLARPLAGLLSVPQLAGGMQLLALVPAFMAISNLGAFTYAREMHFERSVSLEIIPQLVVTLAAWPMAAWLQDFRAFIWLQISKAALSVLVSYFVAGRRYALGFKPEYCREILRFSWPLIVSGFIMLCSSQGDRLLMTRGFTLEELGTYAVAWYLAATPSFALLKVIGGTALPMMAKAAGNEALMRTRYALVAQLFSLCGTLFAVTMVVGGEEIFQLLYGNKYAGAGILAGVLSCGHAVRMIRGAPTGVAWGSGETGSQMLGNIIRLSGLALVIPVVLLKLSFVWVAAAGLIGETLALLASVIAVRRLHRMGMFICIAPALAGAGCVLTGAFLAFWVLPNRNLLTTFAILMGTLSFSVFLFARIFPELGGEIAKIWTALGVRARKAAWQLGIRIKTQ